MTIGVMMCALKEKRWISQSIHQFDDFPEIEVIVACSKKSWFGDVDHDDTYDLAIKAGATVKLHDWRNEKDQKNWIMDKMQGKDWVLLFAPDMFMTNANIKTLLSHLESGSDRAYGCEMITYWRDFDHEVSPRVPFNNVAIRPNEVFEYSSRIKNFAYFPILTDVTMHHLSFVRKDDEMETKIKTWSHAPEVLPEWYQSWKDNKPMGITQVNDVLEIKEYHLPEEIKNKL